MSRGLGVVQEELLRRLEEAKAGISVTDLPGLLDLQERRSRAVVASLAERGLVEVAYDVELGRRAWIPAKRREFVTNRAYVQTLIKMMNTPKSTCPNCGYGIEHKV